VIAVLYPTHFITVLSQYLFGLFITLPFVLAITIGIAAYLDDPSDAFAAARKFIGKVRVKTAARIMIIAILVLVAYNTFKSNIPSLVAFYADPYLADLDEFLLGKAPWQFLHRLPAAISSTLVDFFYSIVWFGQWLGVLLYAALWNGGARRERYLWALALTFLIVGSLMAMALSSVGPVFYDQFYGSDRFAHLNAALQLDGPVLARRFVLRLLDAHLKGAAAYGTGISAMPSMHMAVSTLNALFLTTLRQRALTVAAWCFVAVTLFGSVYSGWHYLADGYVSMAVVTLIWWLTGRFFASAPAGSVQPKLRGVAIAPAVAEPVQAAE